jgi:hypothetical protein
MDLASFWAYTIRRSAEYSRPPTKEQSKRLKFMTPLKCSAQMFTGKEVFEDVKLYADWRPEIMSIYARLAHEAPK